MTTATSPPADPVGSAIAVYDRVAAGYNVDWDGFVAPEMASVVDAAGPGGRVLDAGCGPGRDLAAFTQLGVDPLGVDLSSGMVAVCAANGHPAMASDLRHLPLADGTFAGVWASASLVHLDSEGAAAALAELHRVSRAGAVLFANVKHLPDDGSPTGWEGNGANARFFHYWTQDGFGATVAAAGFTLRSIERVNDTRRAGLSWVHVLAVR